FESKRPELPFATHRLVFAAAVCTDAAIGELSAPKSETEGVGIWDELRMGTANRLGWLGKTLAPGVRMALRDTNATNLVGQLVKPKSNAGSYLLSDIPCQGPDLFVAVTARGEPLKNMPRERAGYMTVKLVGTKSSFATWLNEKEFTSGYYFNNV